MKVNTSVSIDRDLKNKAQDAGLVITHVLEAALKRQLDIAESKKNDPNFKGELQELQARYEQKVLEIKKLKAELKDEQVKRRYFEGTLKNMHPRLRLRY